MDSKRTVQQIGVVRNSVPGPERPSDWALIESDLVIDARWVEALDGVEALERLSVIWWFDRREGEEVPMRVHPRGDLSLPLRGLFATRTPIRPNLLGMTTVEMLSRVGNVLHVRGLDAFSGSPIIDLKPA
jgi:tRNA-Thr(GGU) m(6)t(6)A37 methyltransferase TsaA